MQQSRVIDSAAHCNSLGAGQQPAADLFANNLANNTNHAIITTSQQQQQQHNHHHQHHYRQQQQQQQQQRHSYLNHLHLQPASQNLIHKHHHQYQHNNNLPACRSHGHSQTRLAGKQLAAGFAAQQQQQQTQLIVSADCVQLALGEAVDRSAFPSSPVQLVEPDQPPLVYGASPAKMLVCVDTQQQQSPPSEQAKPQPQPRTQPQPQPQQQQPDLTYNGNYGCHQAAPMVCSPGQLRPRVSSLSSPPTTIISSFERQPPAHHQLASGHSAPFISRSTSFSAASRPPAVDFLSRQAQVQQQFGRHHHQAATVGGDGSAPAAAYQPAMQALSPAHSSSSSSPTTLVQPIQQQPQQQQQPQWSSASSTCYTLGSSQQSSPGCPGGQQCRSPMSPNDALSLGINLEQYISKRNERERSRVRNVNDAFDNLKNSLPLDVERLTKRMSKVEILRTAISYIRNLEDILGYKQQKQQQHRQADQHDFKSTATAATAAAHNQSGASNPALSELSARLAAVSGSGSSSGNGSMIAATASQLGSSQASPEARSRLSSCSSANSEMLGQRMVLPADEEQQQQQHRHQHQQVKPIRHWQQSQICNNSDCDAPAYENEHFY